MRARVSGGEQIMGAKRIVLPLAQVMIASTLTTHNLLRPDPWAAPAWTKADRQLCDGLNAPATLVRALLIHLSDKLLPGNYLINLSLETGVYYALVWALWYLVALEYTGGGVRYLRMKDWVRRTSRVLGAGVAILFVAAGLLQSGQLGGNYGRLVSLPYFAWAAVFVVVFGRGLRRMPPGRSGARG